MNQCESDTLRWRNEVRTPSAAERLRWRVLPLDRGSTGEPRPRDAGCSHQP